MVELKKSVYLETYERKLIIKLEISVIACIVNEI